MSNLLILPIGLEQVPCTDGTHRSGRYHRSVAHTGISVSQSDSRISQGPAFRKRFEQLL